MRYNIYFNKYKPKKMIYKNYNYFYFNFKENKLELKIIYMVSHYRIIIEK